MKRRPIKERIRDAYQKELRASYQRRLGYADYHRVLSDVFPANEYPNAWRYSSNGGPPGCAMAFNRAVREMGGRRDGESLWLPEQYR